MSAWDDWFAGRAAARDAAGLTRSRLLGRHSADKQQTGCEYESTFRESHH